MNKILLISSSLSCTLITLKVKPAKLHPYIVYDKLKGNIDATFISTIIKQYLQLQTELVKLYKKYPRQQFVGELRYLLQKYLNNIGKDILSANDKRVMYE